MKGGIVKKQMAGDLKEVIERLKAQKLGVSQKSKPIEKQKVELNPLEQEYEDTDVEDDETEEKPVEEKIIAENKADSKNTENKSEITPEQQVQVEIEMLQNSGRFRAELLFQLQEINKALVVIAGALVK